MIQFVTQFAADESSSGIGALGLNLTSLIIQLVTFVLAFLVLRQFAFKPIGKVLRERREVIESGVSLGEEMKKERAELDKKISDELHAARLKADGIVAEAHDAGRAAIAEAETKARDKAEGIINDAKSRGEQDVQQMRKDLEKELVGLVSDATEAIIDEKVDAAKDAALIDKALLMQRAAGKAQKSGSTA
jgi:F-type H+-transporting ATPase subunit b